MRYPVITANAAILIWLAAVLPAWSAWNVVDDFEYMVGSGPGGSLLSGDGGWSFIDAGISGTDSRDWRIVPDPAGGSNRVLQLGGEYDITLSKNFPGTDRITNAETGTLYFRFQIKATGTNSSVGVGLADSVVSAAPTDAAGWININAVTGGTDNETIQGFISNGGGAIGSPDTGVNVADNLSEDTWYSLWMVQHNAVDAVDLFIQGGTAYPTQTQIGAGLVFRYNTPNDLARVWLRPNNNNNPATDVIYFDDVWIDPAGQNLSVPSPISLRGDFDGVGGVTTADFEILASNFFATDALYAQGDFDLDQTIGLRDFNLFREAYHAANPSLPALTVADLWALVGVPEPSSAALAGLAGVALAAQRRSRDKIASK